MLWKVADLVATILFFQLKQWQLNISVPGIPEKTLANRLSSLGELSSFASELEPIDIVLKVFPEQPAKDLLHIIVQPLAQPASDESYVDLYAAVVLNIFV